MALSWSSISLAIAAVSGSVLAQPCEPYWAGTGSPLLLYHAGGFAVFDDGSGPKLYAGDFIPNNTPVRRWDGQSWDTLEAGMPPRDRVGPPYVFDYGAGPSLFVRVRTSGVGGGWTFMRWTGSLWVPAPEFMSGEVLPVISVNDAGGPTLYGIRVVSFFHRAFMRWNGEVWEEIGAANGSFTAYAEFDDGSGPKLHVAGGFNVLAGQPIRQSARWTGSSWEPLGEGASAKRMLVHDDGTGPQLYILGNYNGGASGELIARWDGKKWSNLPGGGILLHGITTLHALGSFDDGTGPALFVGGYMNLAAGGVPVRGIARWKNGVWDNMHGGTSGGIASAFAVYDDGRGPSLFVGGEFYTVGSGAPGAALGIAQWVGCTSQCYADCDISSTHPRLNIDDFTCFVRKFAYGDPYVDCNQDGQRNIDDFTCFINRFAAGCP